MNFVSFKAANTNRKKTSELQYHNFFSVMDKVDYSILLCRLNLSEFKMKFCVALKSRIFSAEDLDPKSKILIFNIVLLN